VPGTGNGGTTLPVPGTGNGGTTLPVPGTGNGGTTTPVPGTGSNPDPGTGVVVDPGTGTTVPEQPPVLGPGVPPLSPGAAPVPAKVKPAQTALPTTIGMLGASADAQAADVASVTAGASAAVSQSTGGTGRHATTTQLAGTDATTVVSQHLQDSATAPVGLTAAGSTHNTSVAAGASGSVTSGGASASVLGLLESIFGLGADHSGVLGPLANVQDYAWRLPRMPGFAPD
jgi:hypothetical protein